MSREELVSGYAAGRVSRRVFVKGLVALGVSGAAAVAYANALGTGPTPRASAAAADLYDQYDLYPSTPPAVGAGAAVPVSAQPAFTG